MNHMLRRIGVAAALAVFAVLTPAPAHATDPAPLPVPYTFLSGAAQAITQPGSPLAGANDWSCRPSAEHPRPVVLLHGTAGGGATNWATYGPLLHNAGYCVFTLTYGNHPEAPWPLREIGAIRSLPDVSVPEAAAFVDRVLDATGARQIDLVGHSQGTFVAGVLAKHVRPGRIGTVVSLAALWNGTGGPLSAAMSPAMRAGMTTTGSAAVEQLSTGSDYVAWLRGPDDTPYAPGVRYVNIATRYDEGIIPYTSGLEPAPDRPGFSVVNHTVQDGCEQDFAEHAALPADPRAADLALDALGTPDARPPRCVLIVPVHGAVGPVAPR